METLKDCADLVKENVELEKWNADQNQVAIGHLRPPIR